MAENVLNSLHHPVHIFKSHIGKKGKRTDPVGIPFRIGK
jgi:hypothetical protein